MPRLTPRTLPPAPEEWLILMSDLALGLGFGLQPASLSGHVLGVSWYNKCFAAAWPTPQRATRLP